MKHHIIVKFNDTAKKKEDLYEEIQTLFQDVTKIEGIHSVSLHPSVINRPNRYDLMILLEMDREALPAFDASDVHLRWKAEYAGYLESKAIFDCD